MTDRLHHWTFFQRLHTNHVLTFFSSSARCSGSDFMIWSNSANWYKHTSIKSTVTKLSWLKAKAAFSGCFVDLGCKSIYLTAAV